MTVTAQRQLALCSRAHSWTHPVSNSQEGVCQSCLSLHNRRGHFSLLTSSQMLLSFALDFSLGFSSSTGCLGAKHLDSEKIQWSTSNQPLKKKKRNCFLAVVFWNSHSVRKDLSFGWNVTLSQRNHSYHEAQTGILTGLRTDYCLTLITCFSLQFVQNSF